MTSTAAGTAADLAAATLLSEQGWRLQRTPAANGRWHGQRRGIAGVQVVEHWLETACVGRRRGSGEDFLAVVYVIEGREVGFGPAGRLLLQPGDVVTWHSGQSIGFRVVEPLRKLMLLVPRARCVVPNLDDCSSVHIAASSPLGSLLAGFFGSLAACVDALPERHGEAAVDMSLELVAKAVAAQRLEAADGPGDALVARLLDHIERHLDDPDLTPAKLAEAQGISTRYLQALFARKGITMSGWVRERRLERCRQELRATACVGTLTDLALRWGFNDPSHFSRLFGRRFGMSPTAYRRHIAPAH